MQPVDIHFDESNYGTGSALCKENILSILRNGLRTAVVLAQVSIGDPPNQNACLRVDIKFVIINTHAQDKVLVLMLSNSVELIIICSSVQMDSTLMQIRKD
jgi:hypothetical protein